jgi:hypothetical protein
MSLIDFECGFYGEPASISTKKLLEFAGKKGGNAIPAPPTPGQAEAGPQIGRSAGLATEAKRYPRIIGVS